MSLRDDLNDCIIDFNRRVLVTDLLQEYELPYQEVHKILSEFLEIEKEQSIKYLKRFLVHGKEKTGRREIFTVVEGETKLQEWLAKLQNAESSLYSVELASSKAPPPTFSPVKRCGIVIKDLKKREGVDKINGAAKETVTTTIKTESKAEVNKLSGLGASTKKTELEVRTSNSIKSTTESTKNQPIVTPKESKKTPPPTEKCASEKTNSKKSINSFFSTATKKDTKENTKSSGVVKPPTPKNMQDFFKKSNEKPASPKEEKVVRPNSKQESNTSIELFAADEAVSALVDSDSSSDEEEKLEALKRDIITADEKEEASTSVTASKRRRIEDSDDEEPHQKHDKMDKSLTVKDVDEEEAKPQSQTYLDEEGFVITIKSKQSQITGKPNKKSSPPSIKEEKKSPSPKNRKSKATPASKTKQGNIMNFFSKK